MFQEFPKWVHCEGKASIVVDDAAAEADFVGVAPESAPASREGLADAAESLGIKVDKRWSDRRLAQEITKAA